MILGENVSGHPRSVFDWFTGRSDVSIFEPSRIGLALVFIFVFTAGYALSFFPGEPKQIIPAVILTSIGASILYFGFVFLAVRFEPSAPNICVRGDGEPNCLPFFEHGLLMVLSTSTPTDAFFGFFRRLADRNASNPRQLRGGDR
jgi:hypothetical protein